MSTGFASIYGGFGFALSSPQWEVVVTRAKTPGAVERVVCSDPEYADYVRALLSRLHAVVGPGELHVLCRQEIPGHVGLGAKTALGCAVLAGAFAVTGRGDWANFRHLLHRGGASGVGINVSLTGGLVLDAGHLRGDEKSLLPSSARPGVSVPPLLARHNLDFMPPLLLARPASVAGLHGPAERRFFAEATPISEEAVGDADACLLHNILPAVVRRDPVQLAAGLESFQQLAFKKLEWSIQSERSHEFAESARRRGAQAVALSGMGPTLAVFTPDASRLGEDLQDLYPDFYLEVATASSRGLTIEGLDGLDGTEDD